MAIPTTTPQALTSPASHRASVALSQRFGPQYQALGDDRPGPRLYYLDGELELVTTSKEHERVKKWIGDFVGDYFFQHGVEIVARKWPI